MRKIVPIHTTNIIDKVYEMFFNDYDSELYRLTFIHSPQIFTFRRFVTFDEYFKEKGIRAKYVGVTVFVCNNEADNVETSDNEVPIPYVEDFFVFFDMMDYLRFV